jgi:hypothetical protein
MKYVGKEKIAEHPIDIALRDSSEKSSKKMSLVWIVIPVLILGLLGFSLRL